MTAAQRTGFTARIPSYTIELTAACNNDCLYCYNVWKGDGGYRARELNTEALDALLARLVAETGCSTLILSGGEPTLRRDILHVLDTVRGLGCEMLMISNGARFADEERARACIDAGCASYEVTLLSHRAEVHDHLVRNEAWADTVCGIEHLKKHGASVVITFIATDVNLRDMAPTLDLAISLGADRLVLNRVVCSGEGARHINELMPDLPAVHYALAVANLYGARHGYHVQSTIPIQPCLIHPDPSLFRYVTWNRCSLGTDTGSYTIDPAGRVRPCAISGTILGDFTTDTMQDILDNGVLDAYVTPHPEICDGCTSLASCRGGCRAAAESCYGSPGREDPFLRINRSLTRQTEIFPVRLK